MNLLSFSLPLGSNALQNQLSVFTVHGTPKQYSASYRRAGNFTGNHRHTCTPEEAKVFATVSRNQKRLLRLALATEYVNKVAGGESRKVRRAMARDRAKRTVIQ